MKTKLVKIFKKASTTFYNSSMFFPEDVRSDVVTLYAFVRIADNFVDNEKPDADGIREFIKNTKSALKTGKSSDEIIQGFVELSKRKHFETKWVTAFLNAMVQDLSVTKYESYRELQKYMYGSAEVIGLMMAKILDLPKESERYARYQGEAFQLINFIRDVGDDLARGRVYLPQEDLREVGLKKLSSSIQKNHAFESLIQYELDRFFETQSKAEEGYKYIPKKYLIPIKTASDMFVWTAEEIQKNPSIVLHKQIKPSTKRVKMQFMKNMRGIV